MKSTTLKAGPDAYAKGSNGTGTSDPVRLATITMRAVDEIGNATAAAIEASAAAIEASAHKEAEKLRELARLLSSEIEKGATAIQADAKLKADRLRELAASTRDRSNVESDRVSEFCTMSTTVLEGIRDLEVKIAGRQEPQADDGEEVPRFLKKGPADATPEPAALN